MSTIVNRGTPLKAYVFRNYNLPPGVRSHYLGGCQYQLWQALRASSAAPGYFQEFALGADLHQVRPLNSNYVTWCLYGMLWEGSGQEAAMVNRCNIL